MKNKKILCCCGRSYHPKQAWIHERCASNSAASNKDTDASNKAMAAALEVVSRAGGDSSAWGGPRPDVRADSVVSSDPTHAATPFRAGASSVAEAVDSGPDRKQRWPRDAYNRYMREYMRLKRAGFIGIPYG